MSATTSEKRRPGRPRTQGDTCMFPGCVNKPVTRGLCHPHAMQRYRTGDLKPIRIREDTERLPGLTVTVETAEALKEYGPTPYLAARQVLESWAQVWKASK